MMARKDRGYPLVILDYRLLWDDRARDGIFVALCQIYLVSCLGNMELRLGLFMEYCQGRITKAPIGIVARNI